MEKEMFTFENQRIGEKAECVNALKAQIVLKVAALEQLRFLKAEMEQKCKNLDNQLTEVKEKQYRLLKNNVNEQCRKVELTKKIENEAMQAALAVRQKNRISVKLEQTRTQIEQLRNSCYVEIEKQKGLKQQLNQATNAESELKKESEQFGQKIVDYNQCYEEKLRANQKLNQVLHYYQQKCKELELVKTEVRQKLSQELETQVKLQNLLNENQQTQQKTTNLLTKHSQQVVNLKSQFEAQSMKNHILKQKYLNVKQKMSEILNKNAILKENLFQRQLQKQKQNKHKQRVSKAWQQMRLKISLEIEYANHFVKEVKSF